MHGRLIGTRYIPEGQGVTRFVARVKLMSGKTTLLPLGTFSTPEEKAELIALANRLYPPKGVSRVEGGTA